MAGLLSSVIEFVLLSVPTAVYLWFRRRREDRGRPAMGLDHATRSDWARAAGAAVILIALGLVATRLIPADVMASAGSTNRITGVLAAVAVAVRSAGEEVLFRGFLQGVLANRFGSTAAIWVQGVAFLLPHLPLLLVSPAAWPILPVQLLTGLVLGCLRARHDSIAPPVAVHVLANLVAGLVA